MLQFAYLPKLLTCFGSDTHGEYQWLHIPENKQPFFLSTSSDKFVNNEKKRGCFHGLISNEFVLN
ncbi:hypothetical protein D8674_028669 [Pyrus ussuriensis x Pyrus communis]|uniref:Uncharacterized protein n=1 Tax=Pyrus ussuriensis x Pyrus communis TaxID=2448454 RepID=A0A5N5I1Y9_9ROSA|nr:hypothetical protein D8674_028669 [Pyrus ussuriensis x Pyrus communis]